MANLNIFRAQTPSPNLNPNLNQSRAEGGGPDLLVCLKTTVTQASQEAVQCREGERMSAAT